MMECKKTGKVLAQKQALAKLILNTNSEFIIFRNPKCKMDMYMDRVYLKKNNWL